MNHIQDAHPEWDWQWKHLEHGDEWLFRDWIHPNTLADFEGKRVLDAGCGGGYHLRLVAPVAAEVVGIDLNTSELAGERLREYPNVSTLQADIAAYETDRPFDIVYSIGVIHHTDSPDKTFENLARLTKPGGKTIVWVYSHEGNALNRHLVEPLKRWFILKMSKPSLKRLAWILTVLLYPIIYTVYLLPLPWLPYFAYFENWRKLTFQQNFLNVFDKLNAPQTFFISEQQIKSWFENNGYTGVHISPYRGVSWRGSGTKI